MRATIITILFTFFLANAQEKVLDFDFSMSREFYPEYVYNVSWRSNSQVTWIQSKTNKKLLQYDGNIDTVLTVARLNSFMKTRKDSLRTFPAGHWADSNSYFFENGTGYWIYDLSKNTMQKKFNKADGAESYTLSPADNGLAYIKDQNLYYLSPEGKEIEITRDGGGDISYGIAVHQREFGISGGIFWSPEGKYIAYYREDKSMVTKYPYVNYTTRPATPDPEMYPMAGMKNTAVSVWIYNTQTGKNIKLDTGEPVDQYLTNITWQPDGKKVYIAHVNRDQNHMRLITYDPDSGQQLKTLFEEKDDKYVEPENGPWFINDDSKHFLWQSERDGWNHLYLYENSGKLVRRLTKGEWEVVGLYGADASGENVFIVTTKDSPLDRTVYRVNIASGEMKALSKAAGIHRFYFNKEGSKFLDYCNSGKNPGMLTFGETRGEKREIVFNSPNPWADYKMPEFKLGEITAADGKTMLKTRMIFPPDFDQNKKYPVLVYVYGGPHAQLITNRWGYGANGWLIYMAAQGYIVFTVDSRGSAYRGLEFEQETFRRLSELEIADQVKGVEFLKSLPYVDAERIGLHGWSYGGYMTVSLMLRSGGLYKVAIAGAPVIDWKYYETVYTERYMDTPEMNPEGYEMANALNYVDSLKGRLMVIHGTSDHVVMWQHSILFVDKCIKKMKLVDYMIYPGHDHGIRGRDRVHLYMKMTRYFNDFLK